MWYDELEVFTINFVCDKIMSVKWVLPIMLLYQWDVNEIVLLISIILYVILNYVGITEFKNHYVAFYIVVLCNICKCSL